MSVTVTVIVKYAVMEILVFTYYGEQSQAKPKYLYAYLYKLLDSPLLFKTV